MKMIKIAAALVLTVTLLSCGETKKQETTDTVSTDTMVMQRDITDSATNSVTTDTTKR
ncbi:MAG: hypothetical protein H7257_11305 [Taibaiella sp.]|nr:hypothetical protein [Taibaiella sp.]